MSHRSRLLFLSACAVPQHPDAHGAAAAEQAGAEPAWRWGAHGPDREQPRPSARGSLVESGGTHAAIDEQV